MMLTSRGFSFLSGSFIALLTSTVLFPYPPLILLSLFLFFTSAFHALIVHSSYLSKIRPEDFTVNTGVSSTFSFLDKETQVEVEVIYKGARRIFCRIEDQPNEALTINGKACQSGVLDIPQSSLKMSYSVSAPKRGVYNLGPVLIKVVDDHDLCSKEMRLGPIRELVFMPRIKKIRGMLKGPKVGGLLFHEGSATNRLMGPEEDFVEVREYTPGDRMRHVDWKAVARSWTDEIYVRTFERRKQADVLFVLCGNPLELVNERLTEAATSFAEFFADAGDRVGLVASGFEIVSIKPAGGKAHLRNIIRGIAKAAYLPDPEPVSRELWKVLAWTMPFATVIVFGWPEKELFKTIVDVCRVNRHRTLILTPTFSSIAKLLKVPDPEARLEEVDATWENSIFKRPPEGVVVLTASVENLEGSLTEALKLLKRRGEFAA